ncbi:hypothetical protein RBH29_14895 [Herbivorax sp. ANBcel31]|uniref:hypothetical protein n=1 Tax=Herbivorax sp. ANBcel31 TaxID=3069754 RepID=UPI0027B58EC9|nr:hypothetical protein [Herbivorax sp. ANBcel31]MDQ2087715.1 hypothetical protein [Herbivorax sp. ANBcel31]
MSLKEKKFFKISLFIFIIIISIVQILLVYKVINLYIGIYYPSFLPPAIGVNIYSWYRILFKGHLMSKFRLRASIVLIITILIPVFLFTSAPAYTYDDGKALIEEKVSIDDNINYDFVMISGENNILSGKRSWKFYVNKGLYYYRLDIEGEDIRYFTVSPFNGTVVEQEVDFFLAYR